MTTPAQPLDTRLPPSEAAQYLGVKPQTLAAWRCTGRQSLRYIKIGSRIFYRQSDLDEFLNRRTVTPTDWHQ